MNNLDKDYLEMELRGLDLNASRAAKNTWWFSKLSDSNSNFSSASSFFLKSRRASLAASSSTRYTPLIDVERRLAYGMEQEMIEMSGGCRYMHNPPEPFLIEKMKRDNRRVTLNVGGERHEVLWKTLSRIPNSRLGMLYASNTHDKLLELCDDYSLVDNEFYFSRHPLSFSSILNFYRSGKFHLVREISCLSFSDDLEYWGIDSGHLEFCCQFRFNNKQECVYDEVRKEGEALNTLEDEDFGDGTIAILQKWGWDTMEKPTSSFPAKVVSTISVSFVVISTMCLALNTMPKLQMFECLNITDIECVANLEANPPVPGEDLPKNVIEVDNIYLGKIEAICIYWFSAEWLLRFLFCPDKKAFIKGALNIIDVVAIMPFYLGKFMMEDNRGQEEEEGFKTALRKFMQIFRLMRILRVFKLGRHSRGLQSLGYTVTNSWKELLLLIMCISLGVLIFSSLAFFAECDDNAEVFISLPHTFWWALITMTTVGYGDMSPITGIGQLVGSLCAILGVLVIAMPIPIIGNNFCEFYQNQVQREILLRQREDLERAKRESSILQLGVATLDVMEGLVAPAEVAPMPSPVANNSTGKKNKERY